MIIPVPCKGLDDAVRIPELIAPLLPGKFVLIPAPPKALNPFPITVVTIPAQV